MRAERTDGGAKAVRRMGPAGSPNWTAMLGAAEDILREEGYGALTSRRVAERIGVKQRLVYYYFRTMDELVVATFRRLAERERLRLQAATESPQPLRAIWGVATQTSDARLVSEFMALAYRVADLRMEVIGFIVETRRMQAGAIASALARQGGGEGIGTGASGLGFSPAAAAIVATSLALTLNREANLGVDEGHREASGLIASLLNVLEPAVPPE